MDLKVFDSPDTLARYAADFIAEFIRTDPHPVLGLATGGTMPPIYSELIRTHRVNQVSFLHANAYLLDEYVGLEAIHPQTYRNVIQEVLTDHIGLASGAVHGPRGDATDLVAECARYEREVAGARIGLQLLGIGRNGHIGFNEPGASLNSTTRVVSLAPATRADNARFFDEPGDVPHRAITQGIGTIRSASRLLVIASGAGKAPAVEAAILGPITPEVPASALQLHPRVVFMLDREAASRLATVMPI